MLETWKVRPHAVTVVPPPPPSSHYCIGPVEDHKTSICCNKKYIFILHLAIYSKHTYTYLICAANPPTPPPNVATRIMYACHVVLVLLCTYMHAWHTLASIPGSLFYVENDPGIAARHTYIPIVDSVNMRWNSSTERFLERNVTERKCLAVHV